MAIEEAVHDCDETKELPNVGTEIHVSFLTQLANRLASQGHPSDFVSYCLIERDGKQEAVARVYCYNCNEPHNVIMPGKDGEEILADLRTARDSFID